jgi:26S proteasome regulatory subunit T3
VSASCNAHGRLGFAVDVLRRARAVLSWSSGVVVWCCGQVCTAKMNLSDEVDLEDYVSRPDKISAAEIAAICQEAGLHAVRKNRYVVLPKDFDKGYKANIKKSDHDFEFYK